MNAQNQYDLALRLATEGFKNKEDLSGKPYIQHVLRVCSNLSTYPLNIRIIALLHDVLEDLPEWNEKSLRSIFDSDIIDVVVILTKLPNESYDDYIARVMTSKEAMIVKLHDLEDNMDVSRLLFFGNRDFQRLEKYHKAYLKILEKLPHV